MPCFRPLQGYKGATLTKNGKRQLVFSASKGYLDLPQTVACGQCIGCRLERSRQWAIRCVHESQLHEISSFITLTYSDDKIPENGTLIKKHFQDFMKRLRKYHAKFTNGKPNIRYFHCGEYGGETNRPHYHALLFGLDFADKVYHKKSESGATMWRSEKLNELWGHGHCYIGEVNFESAAYVARYVLKKITGEMASAHYQGRQPEYITMSLKPAIGAGWFQKFHPEVFPSDFIVLRGKKMPPPKYYAEQLKKLDAKLHDDIKYQRVVRALKNSDNSTPSRLAVREQVTAARVNQLRRNS